VANDIELPSLERRRATDDVYDVLRQSILSNRFKPGQRLPVDDIARQLGVSLTPVRHAIQQLATEGLIEIRPRSGTFVASLDISDIAETFDIRVALECLAAERAVVNATAEQLKHLRRLAWALSEPVESEADRTHHEEKNSELHCLLIECSGNRRLCDMYESLKAHLQIARIHSADALGAAWDQRLKKEHAEHQEIVAALEARDCDRLVAVLRAHINRAKEDLIRTLNEPGPSGSIDEQSANA
jgi:DNA-binding GntR family transcriptional regulator